MTASWVPGACTRFSLTIPKRPPGVGHNPHSCGDHGAPYYANRDIGVLKAGEQKPEAAAEKRQSRDPPEQTGRQGLHRYSPSRGMGMDPGHTRRSITGTFPFLPGFGLVFT